MMNLTIVDVQVIVQPAYLLKAECSGGGYNGLLINLYSRERCNLGS